MSNNQTIEKSADGIFFWTKSWLNKKQIPFQFFDQAGSSNDLAKQSAFKAALFKEKNKDINALNLEDQIKNHSRSLTEICIENLKAETALQVFLVKKQICGRGQKGRKWEDSDLMISFLWDKNLKAIKPSSAEDFTKDLKTALQRVWSFLPLQIKAPNDLYLEGGKAAGVLLEALSQGDQRALIVGLGLNVFSRPKNIPAACLADCIKDISLKDWNLFLNQLLKLWSVRACYRS